MIKKKVTIDKFSNYKLHGYKIYFLGILIYTKEYINQ